MLVAFFLVLKYHEICLISPYFLAQPTKAVDILVLPQHCSLSLQVWPLIFRYFQLSNSILFFRVIYCPSYYYRSHNQFIFRIGRICQKLIRLYISNIRKKMINRSAFSASNKCNMEKSMRKNIQRDLHTLPTTQSLIPSQFLRESHPRKSPGTNFYHTISQSNLNDFIRPQSKQALRKCVGRPQTSKGVRTTDKVTRRQRQSTKETGFQSQHVSTQMQQQDKEQGKQTIQIIITQSNKQRLEKRAIRSKFQTDLDDQFLQLFAC